MREVSSGVPSVDNSTSTQNFLSLTDSDSPRSRLLEADPQRSPTPTGTSVARRATVRVRFASCLWRWGRAWRAISRRAVRGQKERCRKGRSGSARVVLHFISTVFLRARVPDLTTSKTRGELTKTHRAINSPARSFASPVRPSTLAFVCCRVK